MRDQAFAGLGAHAPGVVITSVQNYTPAQNANITRIVGGYVDVPSYLNEPGGPPGSMLHYTSAALAQDYTRAVLGVPGMEYGLLLNRSVDFTPFEQLLNVNQSLLQTMLGTEFFCRTASGGRAFDVLASSVRRITDG